jgi:aspartate/methionine/tyrosine aminotransferase
VCYDPSASIAPSEADKITKLVRNGRRLKMQESQVLTLSEYERMALRKRINFSDGHARQTLSANQRAILSKTLDFFDISIRCRQSDLEDEFLKTFLECANQWISPVQIKSFMTFSSSSAIKIAAQYCRLHNLKVYLIEPCFDNVYHLLRTEGVPVAPILEDQLCDLEELAARLDPTTVLWLVQPNNPTGFCLNEATFSSIIELVAKKKSMIVVDFAFRLFAKSLRAWNQYMAFANAGTRFIAFEETGKTWSLADTKIGLTFCSDCVAKTIYRLHDELLLNVSPLHLLLITEFMKETIRSGFDVSIRGPVERNRKLVHRLSDRGLILHGTKWCDNVPMELLGLPGEISGVDFWDELRTRGVDILPAQGYFWAHPLIGRSLFRIPLSRPYPEVEAGVSIIERGLSSIQR